MHHILLIDDDVQLGPPLATYFQRFELQLVHALEQNERREADVCQLQAAVEISEQHFQQVRAKMDRRGHSWWRRG